MSDKFFLKYFTINYVLNFLDIIFNEKSLNEKFLKRNQKQNQKENTMISYV